MKKMFNGKLHPREKTRRLIMFSKLFLVFLVLSTQLNATAYSQHQKLSITLKDADAKMLFSKIESISEFIFFYKDEDIRSLKHINIDVKDMLITNILNKCLTDSKLTYSILDRHIIIKKKEKNYPALQLW